MEKLYKAFNDIREIKENLNTRSNNIFNRITSDNKQSTDEPIPSVQSSDTFTAKLIKGAEKALTYPLQLRAMANRRPEIQEEYRQVRILLNACKDRYRELGNQKNSQVPPTGDQEKFLKIFKNADEYKSKAKDILNQVAMDPNELGHFINNLKKANQELKKNKLVQDVVFDASVKKDSSGKITIDLAKFVPSAIDLSKLDLSNPDKIEVTYTSPDKEHKYQFDLYDRLSWAIDKKVKNTLKSSFDLRAYNAHSKLYISVLEAYLKAQLYSKLQKTDLSQKDFDYFTGKLCYETNRLMDENKMLRIQKTGEPGGSIRNDRNYHSDNPIKNYQADPETQRKNNELKALFSDNPTERNVAEEKHIFNAYQAIISPDLEASTEQHNNFETLRQINQNLREIAQNDPEQFRPALTQAMQDTRTLHYWAANFQDRFNLDEEWVQAGMKKLGITNDILETSLKQLPDDLPLIQEILGSRPISDLVGECDAGKIVQHFEDITRANLTLKRINDLLKEGIPVEDTPRQINGLERIPTSGNKMNCLIHALLKVNNPRLDMKNIEKQAEDIIYTLKAKMKERVQLAVENGEFEPPEMEKLLSRQDVVEHNGMLGLGEYDGQELINYLRKDKMIDPDRSLLIYELDKKRKIRCNEHYPVPSSEKKPYSLFLHQDYHFEAMIELQKEK